MTSVDRLTGLLRHHGAKRIYAKKLAPNDNSKNQVYLGGDFAALNIIPHGKIYTDTRTLAGSKRDRPKASVNFCWVDHNGKHPAPNTQLILYPDYPEVRMSSFFKGSDAAPARLMTGRDPGRILFLGITPKGEVLGHVVGADSAVAAEINARHWHTVGVFLELPTAPDQKDSRAILQAELKRIHEAGWIPSQKLAPDGTRLPYEARNAGGFTLEAELGIPPNSRAEPDFMGWEIKQYAVRNFITYAPKNKVTLLTTEPSGGFYRTESKQAFVRRFGYPDKGGNDRLNFGGVYACGKSFHHTTGLKMILEGFDFVSGKITDLNGSLALCDRYGEGAAVWSFTALMHHWNTKHAQAAYVPSIFRKWPAAYAYGQYVQLCEGTDFIRLLKAFADGTITFEPGHKLEGASSAKPAFKPRGQFRIDQRKMARLYHGSEVVDLTA